MQVLGISKEIARKITKNWEVKREYHLKILEAKFLDYVPFRDYPVALIKTYEELLDYFTDQDKCAVLNEDYLSEFCYFLALRVELKANGCPLCQDIKKNEENKI